MSWAYNLKQFSTFDSVLAEHWRIHTSNPGKKDGENILAKRNSTEPKYGDMKSDRECSN